VGWGRANASAIQEMLALHEVAFDLMQRTPYLAKREGSSLLAHIATAIVGRTIGGVALPEAAIRDAKVAIFVGHDTNIANVGGMLDMSWSMLGWQTNETPPAGALRFELREARDGRQRVYVSYVSQSAEQMRNATPLTLSAPPVTTPIRVPACSTSDQGSPCPLEAFAKMIDAALDVECVDKS
jgi:4-phytase / acid phosphatase